MAQFTRRAILQSFSELLETTPFEKITISALTKHCDISPNTFYYHFHDIYDLLDCWLEEKFGGIAAAPVMQRKGPIKQLLYWCKEHEAVVRHLMGALSLDRMEHYLFRSSQDIFARYVDEYTRGQSLSDLRKAEITDFLRFSILGFFMRFLWNNMQDDIETSVDSLEKLYIVFLEGATKDSE